MECFYDKIFISDEEVWFCKINNADNIKQLSLEKIYPSSFSEFLNCIYQTKIVNNDYDIIEEQFGFSARTRKASFDELLKTFAKVIYKNKPANLVKIRTFYSKAYEVRELSIQNAEVLNKEKKELIK